MPEICFEITWPDGAREVCYSPSRVITQYFAAGQDYPLADFLHRGRTALLLASERVAARYGMPCSRALGQLALIERTAERFATTPDACVGVIRFLQ